MTSRDFHAIVGPLPPGQGPIRAVRDGRTRSPGGEVVGYGYMYSCKKCGHGYSIHLGAGMLFSHVYRSTLEEIRSGRYGDQWKELILNGPQLVIDAEKHLYRCRDCGHWEVEPGLTIYAPSSSSTDGDEGGRAGERARILYPWSMDREKYHRAKVYIHKCPECGKRMKRARGRREMDPLPCPECGTENFGEEILWD